MPDPIDFRTGAAIPRAVTSAADLGHPECPKCGGKQASPIGPALRCANCGNIFEEEPLKAKAKE